MPSAKFLCIFFEDDIHRFWVLGGRVFGCSSSSLSSSSRVTTRKTEKPGSSSRSKILSKSNGVMLVPSMLWRQDYWSIYQQGEGWGQLEGWVKSHHLCPPADVTIFVMSMNHEKNGNSLKIVSNTSYTTSCLANSSFSFPPPSIPCLWPSLPLLFLSSYYFCSLFHERHCCDPACATDQDVRPYGYPEQPFSCSWGMFQSVYSF